MTLHRWMWGFVLIGLGCLALAGAGQWLLHWPNDAVHTWLGIGCGYLAGSLMFLLVPRWWRQHCDEMYAQPAGKRYIRALLPIMVFYSLTLFGSIWVIKRGIASVPLRAVIAVLPALAIVLLMRAGLRYLREIDELQRRIETEAIGAASLLVSVLYFAGGLLEKAKVLHFDAAAAMIWVFPLLMLCYGGAKYIFTRRYL
ncbi:MAG: hypothetical protein KUL77_02690 [Thermomonas sp.]|uniref:hypothetical protein n=1 Tax=Thermomonas sp. TaxID=1971895 RepID=UPI001EC8A2CA|nr:hypothetical protein [Thermomonas sp.]MBV2208454.1 hypothetical protein [Thermomonas sp.]